MWRRLLWLAGCTALPAHAALVVVNSEADTSDGVCDAAHCTLREAIESSFVSPDFDTVVDFAIPGGGTRTIALSSPLPVMTRSLTFRGFTQPGAVAPSNGTLNHTLRVQIDGSALSDATAPVGFHFNGAGQFDTLDVEGLAFGGFSRAQGDGIALRVQAGRANIDASHFGIAADGSTTIANDIGLQLESGRNTNVQGNLISGNRVGVLANGARDAGQTPLRVIGNRIGTDKAGTAARPNTEDGLRLVSRCASPAVAFEFDGNLISGNGRDGVHLDGEAPGCQLVADYGQVTGNRIGTTASGTAPLGNGRHGVFAGVLAATHSIEIGGRLNSSFPEDRNTIGFNGGSGIVVPDGAGGVTMRENTYRANVGLPIDLGGDGVTANDAGDADTGPNRLLDTPILGALQPTPAGLQISFASGSASGNARYPMRIDFYASAAGVLTFLQTDFVEAPNQPRSTVLSAALGNAELVAMLTDNGDGDLDGTPGNSSEFGGPALRALFSDGFE